MDDLFAIGSRPEFINFCICHTNHFSQFLGLPFRRGIATLPQVPSKMQRVNNNRENCHKSSNQLYAFLELMDTPTIAIHATLEIMHKERYTTSRITHYTHEPPPRKALQKRWNRMRMPRSPRQLPRLSRYKSWLPRGALLHLAAKCWRHQFETSQYLLSTPFHPPASTSCFVGITQEGIFTCNAP